MLDRKLLHSNVNSGHIAPKSRKTFKYEGWQPTLLVTPAVYAALAATELALTMQVKAGKFIAPRRYALTF